MGDAGAGHGPGGLRRGREARGQKIAGLGERVGIDAVAQPGHDVPLHIEPAPPSGSRAANSASTGTTSSAEP